MALEERMSDEAIERAQRLVREWEDEHPLCSQPLTGPGSPTLVLSRLITTQRTNQRQGGQPMSLCARARARIRPHIEENEGRVPHLYLDSEGYVTVGVGHLVPSRDAVCDVPLYHQRNGRPTREATCAEKKADYDRVVRQRPVPDNPKDALRASAYAQHTRLIMRDEDMDDQLDQHVRTFHRELRRVYQDFDSFPPRVQEALFDMIFTLGMSQLRNKFPRFNHAIEQRDWARAATESRRRDVGPDRNRYVRNLLRRAANRSVNECDTQ